jgi:multidrug efflux pump subunit AcrA (membrane-fusion protein)
MKTKMIWISSLLIFFGLLLSGCDALGPTTESTPAPTPISDPRVIAEANLVPADHSILDFASPGRVSEVLVSKGDLVNQGDVLARLGDTAALDAQVAISETAVLEAEQILADLQAQADLVAARAVVDLVMAEQGLIAAEQAWDVVDTDDFREDLDDAWIDVKDAEEDLEDAQDALEGFEDLDEDNPTREATQDDLEEAQQAYDEALWAFEDLQNQYDLAGAQLAAAQAALEDAERLVDATREGPDPDDLALAESRLAGAITQLDAAISARSDAELTAPYGGKIVRIGLTQGLLTAPGEKAVVLMDDSAWYLETSDLTEYEVVRLELEQDVTISFDALPDLTFEGKVESVSDYYVEQFGDITYVVRITLLDWDARLRWGMTAEVIFEQ